MKILIKLESEFYTDEQNEKCYDEMIELDWNLPFLPRKGESFDCYSIIDKMPDFDDGLCWSVDIVEYEKQQGMIVPILCLIGE
ncbi:hypothetical protein COY27_04730 [Candidatus Woesearchaeota archaeon CG_4_10_14_0_2_um_filter_33_13]|nr:MAG: hypothetical protein COY27_04730 [Candidatus Woesearchaeota archaeon CG_4_10_14_0_2_um_filter_33_13]